MQAIAGNTIAVSAALSAMCAFAAADAVELKTLAVHWDEDGADRFVLGTGSYGEHWWDNRKDAVYDGYGTWLNDGGELVQQGYFEPASEFVDGVCWAGYQVSQAVTVKRIRFLTRMDWANNRPLQCRFEGANLPDFSDAVTLYTIGDGGEDKDSLAGGWQDVAVTNAAAIQGAFTYLRIMSPNSAAEHETGTRCGNVAEVEFYGLAYADAVAAAPSLAPRNVAVSTVDEATDGVAISWEAPQETCERALVLRATSPGGPYGTVVATVASSVLSCEDAVARIPGVIYYYKVAFVNGADLRGPLSEAASHRHVPQIPFDAATMTAIEFHHDYSSADATSAERLFDGDTATNPDVVNASNGNSGVKVGIDFGEGRRYAIDRFEVFPSREWNHTLGQWVVGRSDGILLAGSNNESDWTDSTAISGVCDLYEENVWGEDRLSWASFSTTSSAAYRFVYLMKPPRETLENQRTDDFFGNVRELKLYGWDAAAAGAILLAPVSVAAEWKVSDVALDWEDCQNAAAYRVERSTDGGAWETVADALTASEYLDKTADFRKSYQYRIVSLSAGGAEEAYSADCAPAGVGEPKGMCIVIF